MVPWICSVNIAKYLDVFISILIQICSPIAHSEEIIASVIIFQVCAVIKWEIKTELFTAMLFIDYFQMSYPATLFAFCTFAICSK